MTPTNGGAEVGTAAPCSALHSGRLAQLALWHCMVAVMGAMMPSSSGKGGAKFECRPGPGAVLPGWRCGAKSSTLAKWCCRICYSAKASTVVGATAPGGALSLHNL
ncbi:hypothetical protein Scep_009983 [Stephania cephalantha]|uniref:Uncharacterized protein n=1 Tax=Stephania cephalantha TaxID=152367 RepID=A0AAP0PDM7_9MAGN